MYLLITVRGGSTCQQFVTPSGSAVVQGCCPENKNYKFAESPFAVAGPSVWNSLPADLRLKPDTAGFKSKHKSYFFSSVITQLFSRFNVTVVIRYCTLFYIVNRVH